MGVKIPQDEAQWEEAQMEIRKFLITTLLDARADDTLVRIVAAFFLSRAARPIVEGVYEGLATMERKAGGGSGG